MESLLLRMEPLRSDFEPCTHEGEEFIYILEGTARFTVDGKEYVVTEGESIHSSAQHREHRGPGTGLFMYSNTDYILACGFI